jgi:hypothetical protein
VQEAPGYSRLSLTLPAANIPSDDSPGQLIDLGASVLVYVLGQATSKTGRKVKYGYSVEGKPIAINGRFKGGEKGMRGRMQSALKLPVGHFLHGGEIVAASPELGAWEPVSPALLERLHGSLGVILGIHMGASEAAVDTSNPAVNVRVLLLGAICELSAQVSATGDACLGRQSSGGSTLEVAAGATVAGILHAASQALGCTGGGTSRQLLIARVGGEIGVTSPAEASLAWRSCTADDLAQLAAGCPEEGAAAAAAAAAPGVGVADTPSWLLGVAPSPPTATVYLLGEDLDEEEDEKGVHALHYTRVRRGPVAMHLHDDIVGSVAALGAAVRACLKVATGEGDLLRVLGDEWCSVEHVTLDMLHADSLLAIQCRENLE